MLLDVFGDLPRHHPVVLFETDGWRFDDECLGYFPGFVIGHGDDGAVGDGGVGQEMRFQLGRRDLEALTSSR